MTLPAMPHPHLIVLRTAATVALSGVVAQAGFAAALLDGETNRLADHRTGAWVTLVATVVSAVLYVVLRRSAGAVNVTLAVVLALAVSAQFTLGELDVRAWHIFLGVLIAMIATALTSWTYRHALPDEARLERHSG